PVVILGEDPISHLARYPGHITNLPEFEAAAPGRGYLNDPRDSDGVVRSMPLVIAVNGEIAPSFALELMRVATGQRHYTVQSGRQGINGVQIGTSFIPTDPDGRIRLHFSPAYDARRVSAGAILRGEIAPNAFAGQIAIIGATAMGVADVAATPIAAHMDAAEIHTQLIENILAGSRLIRSRYAKLLEILTTMFAGLLTLLLLPRLTIIWQILILAGVVLIIVAGSLTAFVEMRLLVDPIIPSSTMILVY